MPEKRRPIGRTIRSFVSKFIVREDERNICAYGMRDSGHDLEELVSEPAFEFYTYHFYNKMREPIFM